MVVRNVVFQNGQWILGKENEKVVGHKMAQGSRPEPVLILAPADTFWDARMILRRGKTRNGRFTFQTGGVVLNLDGLEMSKKKANDDNDGRRAKKMKIRRDQVEEVEESKVKRKKVLLFFSFLFHCGVVAHPPADRTRPSRSSV